MEKFEISRRPIRPGSIAEKLVNRGAADGDLPTGFIVTRPRLNVAFKLLCRPDEQGTEQERGIDCDQDCEGDSEAVHSMGSALNANRFANECNDNPKAEQRAAQSATDSA